MYMVVEAGGHQWKVEPGTVIEINRLPAKIGAAHTLDRVLLAADGGQVHVGAPFVAGAQVVCEIISHPQSVKTISYHFRRRENWRKTVGHRQPLTRMKVTEIVFPGGVRKQAAESKPAHKPAPKPAAKTAKRPAAPPASASKVAPKKTSTVKTTKPSLKSRTSKETRHGA
jgi:large subunit ribosomal protein L21